MQIRALKIYSSSFFRQIEFYSKVLGLVLVHQTGNEAQFKIGKSHLVLMKSAKTQPNHLAINILSNRLEAYSSDFEIKIGV